MTYKVKVNEEAEKSAVRNYSYTPTEAGTYTLVFKANDGTADSEDTYTVTLSANQKCVEIYYISCAGYWNSKWRIKNCFCTRLLRMYFLKLKWVRYPQKLPGTWKKLL